MVKNTEVPIRTPWGDVQTIENLLKKLQQGNQALLSDVEALLALFAYQLGLTTSKSTLSSLTKIYNTTKTLALPSPLVAVSVVPKILEQIKVAAPTITIPGITLPTLPSVSQHVTQKPVLETGTIISATKTTLTDSGKRWPSNNPFLGKILIIISSGVYYWTVIESNTDTQLTFNGISVVPAAGSSYQILDVNVEPTWYHENSVTAPTGGTDLVTRTVAANVSGYIYGFFVAAQEANTFNLRWTSGGTAYARIIPIGGSGSIEYSNDKPLNSSLPADTGTAIHIQNETTGSAGILYQASLLEAEY